MPIYNVQISSPSKQGESHEINRNHFGVWNNNKKSSLMKKSISLGNIFGIFEVDRPRGESEELISFGPSFGQEAMDFFVAELRRIGLEYFDEFFDLVAIVPEWCELRAQLKLMP